MIESVTTNTIDELLPLIRQYQEFYKIHSISDENNRAFFSQFSESNPMGCQFLYRHETSVVGFATVYFTFASSITAKVGVMNDLYVKPEYRAKGIGKKLIEHCYDFVIAQGAARLQWLTATDNVNAQKLYDVIKAKKSEWYFYSYQV
ncbi:MAG: GNAT family N-acetyltransferase [Gammaproteobacteria bacterium]|nr:GNAT family N-acetyltransferase [Gammaproteobacteria bacterium]MDH5728517.1 GNAT family N-acetyltransferase [Gammaproteobacteria bacterium]